MKRAIGICASLTWLWAAAAVHAAPVIILPNIALAPNTAHQFIPIDISGGDSLQGMTLDVYVGTNGNKTTEPMITSIDATSTDAPPTVFGPNHTPVNTNASQKQWWEISLSTSSGTVPATGRLANIEVSTVGINSGLFAFNLNGPSGNTDLSGITPSVTPGSISVPEPASIGLMAVGGFALLARRNRKRPMVAC